MKAQPKILAGDVGRQATMTHAVIAQGRNLPWGAFP